MTTLNPLGFDYIATALAENLTALTPTGRRTGIEPSCKIMQMTAISSSSDHEAGTIWRPDVTVATIVPRDDRFLIVEENVRGALVLNNPAGHLEPDESLADAAQRETREETGWTVDLDHLVGIYQWRSDAGGHFLRFTFAATAVRRDELQALDTGIVRALWLTRAEIAAAEGRLRSPMVLRGIDDWIGGRRLPLSACTWMIEAPA
jgi:8-oxo-dGTP pyrophosphatase MutT (NUDIX family)